eukprot:5911852-Prymnesium_polylepis.3
MDHAHGVLHAMAHATSRDWLCRVVHTSRVRSWSAVAGAGAARGPGGSANDTSDLKEFFGGSCGIVRDRAGSCRIVRD